MPMPPAPMLDDCQPFCSRLTCDPADYPECSGCGDLIDCGEEVPPQGAASGRLATPASQHKRTSDATTEKRPVTFDDAMARLQQVATSLPSLAPVVVPVVEAPSNGGDYLSSARDAGEAARAAASAADTAATGEMAATAAHATFGPQYTLADAALERSTITSTSGGDDRWRIATPPSVPTNAAPVAVGPRATLSMSSMLAAHPAASATALGLGGGLLALTLVFLWNRGRISTKQHRVAISDSDEREMLATAPAPRAPRAPGTWKDRHHQRRSPDCTSEELDYNSDDAP